MSRPEKITFAEMRDMGRARTAGLLQGFSLLALASDQRRCLARRCSGCPILSRGVSARLAVAEAPMFRPDFRTAAVGGMGYR
jgi:hypothetical protein